MVVVPLVESLHRAGYGLLLAAARALPATHMLAAIVGDLRAMPVTMRRLAWVQFFSWFALFAMWIYTTAAVAGIHFGSTDPQSAAYNGEPTGWGCCSVPTTASPRWRQY